MDFLQYKIYSAYGQIFHGDNLRKLSDPIPCRDEIIPDPDPTLLPILNHPHGIGQEIDFAAYDPPEVTPSPVEGGDPVFVLCLSSWFVVLT